MTWCALPTPSTIVHLPGAVPSASNVMQAVLFTEILKPLTAALGPVGDGAISAVTQSLFVRSRS